MSFLSCEEFDAFSELMFVKETGPKSCEEEGGCNSIGTCEMIEDKTRKCGFHAKKTGLGYKYLLLKKGEARPFL